MFEFRINFKNIFVRLEKLLNYNTSLFTGLSRIEELGRLLSDVHFRNASWEVFHPRADEVLGLSRTFDEMVRLSDLVKTLKIRFSTLRRSSPRSTCSPATRLPDVRCLSDRSLRPSQAKWRERRSSKHSSAHAQARERRSWRSRRPCCASDGC